MAFNLRDSPSYLLRENKPAEALEMLGKLGGKVDLTEEYKDSEKGLILPENQEENALEQDFDWKTGLNLLNISFMLSFVLTCILNYIPMFKKESSEESITSQIVGNLLILCAFDLPSNVLSGLIPNLSFLGPRRFLILLEVLSIAVLLCCLAVNEGIVVVLSLAKSLNGVATCILGLIVAELFEAKHRTSMISNVYFLGRISKIVGVVFIEAFGEIQDKLVILVLVGISTVYLVSTKFLPEGK